MYIVPLFFIYVGADVIAYYRTSFAAVSVQSVRVPPQTALFLIMIAASVAGVVFQHGVGDMSVRDNLNRTIVIP